MEDQKNFIKVKRSDFKPSGATIPENIAYYSVLTSEVRRDKRLSGDEKVMYSTITSLSNIKGYCWASNAFFEEDSGKSKSTIKRQLNNLRDFGYIYVEFVVDEENEEQLERRIYPLSQVELLSRLAKNSKILEVFRKRKGDV